MTNEIAIHDLPPDEVLLEIVGDSRDLSLAPSRARRWRRPWSKRIIAVAGAAALFGTGLAVGAATIPPAPSTIAGNPVFAVNCYGPDGAQQAEISWGGTNSTQQPDISVVDAARQNPAQYCGEEIQHQNQMTAILDIVKKLAADGHTCGYIHIPGSQTINFETGPTASGAPSWTFSTGAPTTPLSPDCITVTRTLPTEVHGDSVACEVTDSEAAVYPADGSSAADVCASRDQSVWSGE
jgi:hypothetical protein